MQILKQQFGFLFSISALVLLLKQLSKPQYLIIYSRHYYIEMESGSVYLLERNILM
jgi:hypothetical protein